MKKTVCISIIAYCLCFIMWSAKFSCAALTPIMGESECTLAQMATYLLQNNDPNGLNPIDEDYAVAFVTTLDECARSEGVRTDVAFALMMHETGFLNFGGDVLPEQNNFGGLGATGKGAKGTYFEDMRTGILAVVQHLKCYASEEAMANDLVDPRYSDTLRAKAVYVEQLGKGDNPNGVGWAVPGVGYGQRIMTHIERIKAIEPTVQIPSEKEKKALSMRDLFVLIVLIGLFFLLLKLRARVQRARERSFSARR